MRLFIYMNLSGTLFFILHRLLLPAEKKFFPPALRPAVCRVNLFFFIVPFPALMDLMRHLLAGAGENAAAAVYVQQDKEAYAVLLPVGRNACFAVPKPEMSRMLLFFFWAAAALFFLARNLSGLRGFLQLRRFCRLQLRRFCRLQLAADAAALESVEIRMVRRAQEEWKMKKKLRVFMIEGLSAPRVAGIRHPVLFLPAGWNVPQQVYDMIIRHELAHIRHHDLLFQRLASAVCIFYWYNPVVFLLSEQMEDCDEAAADACACAQSTYRSRIAYGHMILELLSPKPQCQRTKRFAPARRKIMKERFCAIKKAGQDRHKALYVTAASVTAAVLSALSCIPARSYSTPAVFVQMEDGQKTDAAAGLLTVSVEDVRTNGYPVNEYGETYGPLLPEALEAEDAPDLMAVRSQDGVCGYIREAELEEPRNGKKVPAAAGHAQQLYADIYLQDGRTVIGKFDCESNKRP